MKKFFSYISKNIYEGTFLGVIMMFIITFLIMLGTVYTITALSSHNGRVCNYSGKFWVDDSKDKKREGDLKGCFSWEEMIEMERL
jgi:phage FluMu gp28-like protein